MDSSMSPDIDRISWQAPRQVEALIETYAPQVKYLAHRLACRLPASLDLDDLISAGVLGLLDAIKKYDPTQAASLKTYAEFRIQGAMLDYVREWDWVPRSVRDKEHALMQAYATIEREQGRPAQDEEVATWLGLALDTLDHWLTAVRGVSLLSLDTPLTQDTTDDTRPVLAQLTEETPDPCALAETRELQAHLAAAIDALPEQEKVVLSLYYFEELTMREIGVVLGLTESRISQIRTKAILHLRARLQHVSHDVYARA
jgi:RNA polymerase sigma factor FliA